LPDDEHAKMVALITLYILFSADLNEGLQLGS
jgi:hypothetical protein